MKLCGRSRRKVFIGIALFFLCGGLLFWLMNQNESDALPDIPVEYLQNGNIICRHGDGFWSNLIIRSNPYDKRFSHIGVLVVSDGNVTVVHADTSSRFSVTGKVVQESLSTFLGHAKRIGIFRHRRVDANKLASNACRYLGYPFDWKLDDKDNEALYCSELLKLAILQASADEDIPHIKYGNQDVIPVDAFITPENSVELFEWRADATDGKATNP